MSQGLNSSRVGFFLYSPNDKMVLIHKRDDKEGIASRGMWDYFGGSFEPIDLDKPEEALERELYEELGISVNKDSIKFLAKSDNETMYYILFHKYKTREIRLDEGAGFAWFPFEKALDLKTPREAPGCENLITDRARNYLKMLKCEVDEIY